MALKQDKLSEITEHSALRINGTSQISTGFCGMTQPKKEATNEHHMTSPVFRENIRISHGWAFKK
jgi:hypothetical protein